MHELITSDLFQFTNNQFWNLPLVWVRLVDLSSENLTWTSSYYEALHFFENNYVDLHHLHIWSSFWSKSLETLPASFLTTTTHSLVFPLVTMRLWIWGESRHQLQGEVSPTTLSSSLLLLPQSQCWPSCGHAGWLAGWLVSCFWDTVFVHLHSSSVHCMATQKLLLPQRKMKKQKGQSVSLWQPLWLLDWSDGGSAPWVPWTDWIKYKFCEWERWDNLGSLCFLAVFIQANTFGLLHKSENISLGF